MGEIDITLTVVQTGSALNGSMLDAVLNWIKTNLTNNLPAGWTLTTQILTTLTQFSVTIRINQTSITISGAVYSQVLAWLQTNATSKLPNNYTLTANINIMP
jgi:hypothetical protein